MIKYFLRLILLFLLPCYTTNDCQITNAKIFSYVDIITNKDLGDITEIPANTAVYLQCKNGSTLFNNTNQRFHGYLYVVCKSDGIYDEWENKYDNTKADLSCSQNYGSSCNKPKLEGISYKNLTNINKFPADFKEDGYCDNQDWYQFKVVCDGQKWNIYDKGNVISSDEEIKAFCQSLIL